MKLGKSHKSLILAVLPIILYLIAYAVSALNVQIVALAAVIVFAAGSVIAVAISVVLAVKSLKTPSKNKKNESRNMAVLALLFDIVWIAVMLILIYHAMRPPMICVSNPGNALSAVPC
jgi:hypothetical protein